MSPRLDDLDAPPLFILGTAASGANWVYEFLTSYIEVAGVRESWIFADGGSEPARRMRERLQAALGPHHRFVVEKSAAHVFHAPDIATAFPSARFLHVVRDGRDVALKVWRDPRPRPERWKSAFGTTLKSAARSWARAMRSIEETKPMLGDRFMEIRFEDINFDHFTSARRILDFSGIGFDTDRVLGTLSADEDRLDLPEPPEPWKTHYSNWRAWRFHRVAGDMLVKTRYADDAGWWFRPFTRS